MADTSQKLSPPYAAYSSFSNFINGLRETDVPPRIDRTVFGNASGSLIYSILASLKSLKLIDDAGVPTKSLHLLVAASDEKQRAEVMRSILKVGFPTLWNGSIDVSQATAGQFDEHIRVEYDVKGSTLDKIAAFFLAAAADADIPISSYLKARRSQAASAPKRNGKRRRTEERAAAEQEVQQPPAAQQRHHLHADLSKPLEYQLIDLMKEPDIEDDVKTSIWSLVQFLMARKAKQTSAA